MRDRNMSDRPRQRKSETSPEVLPEVLQVMLRQAATRAADDGIKPFFAERVMTSIAAAKAGRYAADDLLESLIGWFRPVVVASILIILGFVGFNLKEASTHDLAVSVPESVLGLPAVSVETAFEMDDE